jgi:hypothetical protein
MIPKQTDPMTKFIRTGEGILVFGFNIALLVVPIVSNTLTPAQSAKWATIIDGIAVISRTGLKIVASAQGKPPAAAAAAAVDVAATAAYSLAAAGPAAADAPAAVPAPAADMPVAAIPQLAASLAPDIAAVGQLVTDAEEFADPPPAVQSHSTPPPYSVSPAANGQPQSSLAATKSRPDAPFLTRLGG